jgi:hypothetical protein
MSLDEVAEKLGYIDVEHLENNIYNYGEPLPQWWEVIKELVNNLPLNDVIYCGCDKPKIDPMDYDNFDCLNCNREIKESGK